MTDNITQARRVVGQFLAQNRGSVQTPGAVQQLVDSVDQLVRGTSVQLGVMPYIQRLEAVGDDDAAIGFARGLLRILNRPSQRSAKAEQVIAAAKAVGTPRVKIAVRGYGIGPGLQAKLTDIRRDLQQGVVDLSAISSLEGMLDRYGAGVNSYLIAANMYHWLHAMANGGLRFEVDRQVAKMVEDKLRKITAAEAAANNTKSTRRLNRSAGERK